MSRQFPQKNNRFQIGICAQSKKLQVDDNHSTEIRRRNVNFRTQIFSQGDREIGRFVGFEMFGVESRLRSYVRHETPRTQKFLASRSPDLPVKNLGPKIDVTVSIAHRDRRPPQKFLRFGLQFGSQKRVDPGGHSFGSQV
jgi:hypothetical protein